MLVLLVLAQIQVELIVYLPMIKTVPTLLILKATNVVYATAVTHSIPVVYVLQLPSQDVLKSTKLETTV